MDIFNVHKRDVISFDDYMSRSKEGFGGPNSAERLKDSKGNFVKKDRALNEYTRKVERHDLFSHEVYNPTYKAMGGDLVHLQDDGKNPHDYPDLYDNMGIATVATNEGKCFDFVSFILESAAQMDNEYYDNDEEVCEGCEDEEDEDNISEKKWIQNAIKKPGALRKQLGKKEGEKITKAEIEAEKKKLDTDKDTPGVQTGSKSDLTKLRRLNLASTLKSISKK